jgi:hypothetical protein
MNGDYSGKSRRKELNRPMFRGREKKRLRKIKKNGDPCDPKQIVF